MTTVAKSNFDLIIEAAARKFHALNLKRDARAALNLGFHHRSTRARFQHLLVKLPEEASITFSIHFFVGYREQLLDGLTRRPNGFYCGDRFINQHDADLVRGLILALRWIRRFRPALWPTLLVDGRRHWRDDGSNLRSITIGAVTIERGFSPQAAE